MHASIGNQQSELAIIGAVIVECLKSQTLAGHASGFFEPLAHLIDHQVQTYPRIREAG